MTIETGRSTEIDRKTQAWDNLGGPLGYRVTREQVLTVLAAERNYPPERIFRLNSLQATVAAIEFFDRELKTQIGFLQEAQINNLANPEAHRKAAACGAAIGLLTRTLPLRYG